MLVYNYGRDQIKILHLIVLLLLDLNFLCLGSVGTFQELSYFSSTFPLLPYSVYLKNFLKSVCLVCC